MKRKQWFREAIREEGLSLKGAQDLQHPVLRYHIHVILLMTSLGPNTVYLVFDLA